MLENAEDEAAFITSLVEDGIDAASRRSRSPDTREMRGLHEGVIVR